MNTMSLCGRVVRPLMVSTLLAVSALAFSTPTMAEDTLDKIKTTKKLVVGTEAAMKPFEYVQDGKIVGFGKDILDFIVAELKSELGDLELTQLDLPWQGILPGLDAGKFDFVATSVTITPKRAKKYAFIMPIADGTYYAVKRKGDDSIKSIEDLNGKVVGVQLGSRGESMGKAFDEKLRSGGKSGLKELKKYIAYPEVYLGLANGDTDAVLHGLPSLMVLMKSRPGVYELVGPMQAEAYISWVTRAEDQKLRAYLNTKIAKMRKSGLLYELQQKWFGFKMDVPDKDYLPEGAV